MAMNPLPPQAYTKETLQKAYAWLLNQSPSVKEMANTQEILISLYLKAQRDGDAALETPSIQNFKQELKSLANLMGDLQPNKGASSGATLAASPAHLATSAMGLQSKSAELPRMSQDTQIQANSSILMSPPSSAKTLIEGLDESSIKALEDVRTTLNLSSQTEALRALIALGHKHFRKIHLP